MRSHGLTWLASGLCVLMFSVLPSEAGPATARADLAVALRSGVVHADGSVDGNAAAARTTGEAPFRGGAVVIRFSTPVTPALRAAAARAGVRLSAPLGADAFLGWVPDGRTELARGLPGIAWVQPLAAGLRVAPEIAAIDAHDPRDSVPTTIHLYAHAALEEVRARLARMGIAVLGERAGFFEQGGVEERAARVVIAPAPRRLAEVRDEIAHWPETLWIAPRPAYRLSNDAAAWVGQSGLAGNQATPVFARGLFGQGQVIGILDTGLDADMCFFRDEALGLPPTHVGFGTGSPDPNQRKVRIVNFLAPGESPSNPAQWDTQGHGTHTAGTLAGDNPLTPGVRDAADGMAPQAQLVIQDGGYGVDNCADLPAIGCPAADLIPFFNQAYLQGARIHSNSWGDRENLTPYNIYSDGSQDADEFMWSHPDFLLVFAAGNNGGTTATVASPATAKNVLAVGATNHDFSAGTLASFSSRGPTADGRIKPDVTAPGVGVVSAGNDGNVTTSNCGTSSSSGTSMACPTVAGLAALVREYYEKGYYPSGAPSAPDALAPSAALVKATLVVSATPMEGLAASPPSNEQGWGRVLLDDALYFAGDAKRTFAEDRPARFSSPSDPAAVSTITVLDSTQPLRVVLAWTDYPSTPAAAVNLVNDLDLTVEAPGGAVYKGNVFSNGSSVTGGTADRRNNVEVVRVDAPPAGTWTLRVTPFAVPQPAQGYALVATGTLPAGGVFLERTSLTLDDSIGGNANGVLEPGEWVDLPLELRNTGDALATGVLAQVESLSPHVEVVTAAASLPDIPSGGQAATSVPRLRIRMRTSLACTEPVTLRFTYSSGAFSRQDDVTLPTGLQAEILRDDFEGPNGWTHVSTESTTALGAWTLGDPDGTEFQPENDATSTPGVRCLFTAPNPGGVGSDDVDNGVVVARSGPYDLSGHPEARLRISRWFGNRDVGEDAAGDYFRLHIRQAPAGADFLLEGLGTNANAPRWTEVTFRVADFVAPGPTIQLKASASDGAAQGNIIEAAIDEIVFWEPACTTYDPPPNAITPLLARRSGSDVVLSWARPSIDPTHGETASYLVYRSGSAASGFALLVSFTDAGQDVSRTDPGAADVAPPFFAYLVSAANAAGASDPVPAP